ncbi:MAG TPA: tripartite tricarboxylate transporter substrate binding protein [Burkholderiaceae bacterium]|nr:tripartite tricarboxylate transporter substrate binding protein [Burkholderiaceae bacterium]
MGLAHYRYAVHLVTGLVIGLTAGGAVAQDPYPTRPVRMVVPFPAGGPTDIVARPLAQKLSEALGQQVIVDNRGGAGGTIGADVAAKAAADGYTLLMGTVGTQAINSSLYKKLPYDPARDFAAVSLVAAAPVALVAHPSVQAKSVKELIALAKTQRLAFGSAGSGSPGHLAGVMFAEAAGVELMHVGYKGSAPALNDLIAGQIPLMFDPVQSPLANIKAGKLKPLGVSGAKRATVLSDVPTIAEAGVPGYEMTAWWAVYAPRGTPKDIVARLNSEIAKAMKSADMRDKLQQIGIDPIGSSVAELETFGVSETAKWKKAVTLSGATVD